MYCMQRSVTGRPLTHRVKGGVLCLFCCRRTGWRAVKPCWRYHVHNFSRIVSKLGKSIHYPKISDEFEYGDFASLDMDHFMIQAIFAFVKLKSPSHRIWYKCRAGHVKTWFLFYAFCDFAHCKSLLALSRPWFSWIIFKCGKDIHRPNISDEFYYGCSASLNIRTVDSLISRATFRFLGSFCYKYSHQIG